MFPEYVVKIGGGQLLWDCQWKPDAMFTEMSQQTVDHIVVAKTPLHEDERGPLCLRMGHEAHARVIFRRLEDEP